MNRKYVSVGALCEACDGLATPQLMRDGNLGNFLPLFCGPWQPALLRRVCDFARANGQRIQMDEMIDRLGGDWTDGYRPLIPEIAAILKEYADIVDCTGLLHEYGGIRFYWPKNSVWRGTTRPAAACDLEEAERDFQAVMRSAMAHFDASGIAVPRKTVEARGLAASHILRCGIDKMDVEMTYREDTEMLFGGICGASKAFRKDSFGVDLATLWYGGNVHDSLWYARWRLSLFHAFLRGADPIYAEHGINGYRDVLGNSNGPDSSDIREFRKILADFNRFAAAHSRPVGLPKASIAVMQGRLDGYAGAGQTHLWGIRDDDRFRIGDAERSWSLFQNLYRRRPWQDRDRTGQADFSGNPPDGQADIIPFDTPDDVLASYKAVIFLGRNVMDEGLHGRLLRYVRNGGQLLLTAAHLNTQLEPDGPFCPFRDGDWSELCGVVMRTDCEPHRPFGLKFRKNPPCGWQFPLWTTVCDPKFSGDGFRAATFRLESAEQLAAASERFNDQNPDGVDATTENGGDQAEARAWQRLSDTLVAGHPLGRGYVVLVNSLEYPGASGLRELYSFLMTVACDANRSYPKVESSDRVRYATYPGSPETLYLLNTEVNLEQTAIIHLSETEQRKIVLQPGELWEMQLKETAGTVKA